MATLVVGPTSAGKSTYIQQAGLDRVVFGFELSNKDVLPDATVHYNLLYLAPSLIEAGQLRPEWNLLDDIAFNKLIVSRRVNEAKIIVAPLVELEQRMMTRQIVESTMPSLSPYPHEQWLHIVRNIDLFALYEQLFEILERAEIPYEVLYSPPKSAVNDTLDFLTSDRVNAHHNLRGTYISTPMDHEIADVVQMPGCEYQSVLLHRGRRTSPRGFNHIGDERAAVFDLIRDRTFVNRSILDIGCAVGDMLFRAERCGATHLLGIELKEHRFSAATSIARLIQSKTNLIHGDFLDLKLDGSFDDVLALNVIHHVSDFRRFLMRAARLAKERLVIEFPTTEDPLFRSLSPFSGDVEHLPIVGVSSSKVDQTFVFTRAAVERIVHDAGRFEVTWHPSSITARQVGVFWRVD